MIKVKKGDVTYDGKNSEVIAEVVCVMVAIGENMLLPSFNGCYKDVEDSLKEMVQMAMEVIIKRRNGDME